MSRNLKNGGFTLVEVLASMAILSILILMLGSFFDQAVRAWTSGERQVVTYSEGRGALDEMFRDSTVAIADDALPFAVVPGYLVDDSSGTARLRRASPPFKQNFPIDVADAVRMVCPVSARSVGTERSDLVDVTYWVELGADGRGKLKRRASNLNAVAGNPPRDGVSEYLPGGDLASASQLFFSQSSSPFFLRPDNETETLLSNVYSFEVLPFRSPGNPSTSGYYSKSEPGNLGPARVDFKIRILSDQEWARFETFSSISDWHDYADLQAETFETSAVSSMRGR